MLPSTSSRLRQGPTHVTDTGRCPTPCPNPIEVARLGQLFLCCSRSGTSPSSRACSVLIPALRLSRAAVCAATELSVRCSQDLSDLRTVSVLRPDRRGEPVVTHVRSASRSLPVARHPHQPIPASPPRHGPRRNPYNHSPSLHSHQTRRQAEKRRREDWEEESDDGGRRTHHRYDVVS